MMLRRLSTFNKISKVIRRRLILLLTLKIAMAAAKTRRTIRVAYRRVEILLHKALGSKVALMEAEKANPLRTPLQRLRK